MKEVSIGDGMVPLNEFKTHASRWLKRLRDSGEPFVITQHGRPAGVMVSPEDYDRMRQIATFEKEIALAEGDYEAGRVFSTSEARAYLAKRRVEHTK
jgi:prevent-host-death family protein